MLAPPQFNVDEMQFVVVMFGHASSLLSLIPSVVDALALTRRRSRPASVAELRRGQTWRRELELWLRCHRGTSVHGKRLCLFRGLWCS
mmetsp:Transcript_57643/g.153554  ORF Transcript_57643/g.153554 Transcript_57643/m.153554 type:complete len:88 (-) Transcript_57643:75-338(-)